MFKWSSLPEVLMPRMKQAAKLQAEPDPQQSSTHLIKPSDADQSPPNTVASNVTQPPLRYQNTRVCIFNPPLGKQVTAKPISPVNTSGLDAPHRTALWILTQPHFKPDRCYIQLHMTNANVVNPHQSHESSG